MLSRRGFLGALTAIVAAPRALFARQPLTTLGLTGNGYFYKYTFVSAAGETPVQTPRRLYIDGDPRPIDVPAGASHYVHDDEDVRGGHFTFPK